MIVMMEHIYIHEVTYLYLVLRSCASSFVVSGSGLASLSEESAFCTGREVRCFNAFSTCCLLLKLISL